MPPTVDALPIPTGRGRDAMEWLEANGLMARQPDIRASGWTTYHNEGPFNFYLAYRLGLRSALSYSQALARGSWFHKRLEFCHEPNNIAFSKFNACLDERKKELHETAMLLGKSPEVARAIIDDEELAAQTAYAVFEASSTVSYGNTWLRNGFGRLLVDPSWLCLGSEVEVRCANPLGKTFPMLAGRLDRLYYDVERRSLWILDAKTTSRLSATTRAEVCPSEMQTFHYLYIVNALLGSGALHQQFPAMHPAATLGGMLHLVVEWPTINMSGEDRDFSTSEHVLKSGPNKGQVQIRKEYVGEPKPANFIKRCRDWCLGEGQYLIHKAKRAASPTVVVSDTSAYILRDEGYLLDYTSRLRLLSEAIRCDPIPGHFTRESTGVVTRYGKLSPFAPFHHAPVHTWPEIIKQYDLVQIREEPITQESTTDAA